MGLSLVAYFLLGMTGVWMFRRRIAQKSRPRWLRPFHAIAGIAMVVLVLLLLGIGLVGTIGHYGDLGHSSHLPAGLLVVGLVLLSAWSATQINSSAIWARSLHIGTNLILFLGFLWVSLTGWDVVQKYLP